MKIGITGATGQLGQLVVDQLKGKVGKDRLVAFVRNPEKAKELGVESRPFDYDKPDGLAEQLKGIDRLLLISANELGQRARQHKNVIDAAKNAGIKWLVYTSLLHADSTTINLAGEHLETEKLLKDSGIDHTILRNGWYTENYTGSIGGALAGGAFIGSAGSGKISSAARLDYAEAAAIVLTDESYKGKVFELAGDEAYTLHDLAAEISKQTGKDIPYKNLPEKEYAKILESFSIPKVFADGIASWDVSASKGDLFDDSQQLSKLIGRPTTPMAESVKSALSS
ncbi:SDR family oxidoreductase [Sunxiuqinia dokdonensis]|uniref:NmrA family transcriptional regulator n=1 Tax=Sunxiuqinia dokdonensis TaxID=1409788 RepID=A0A0L8V7J2_9BACT|nr:SDR family oxidoreductase [Sunxiuqinia dokdonensis]KOH44323.1 NmrA family transcriptional regulator [Sunxiuqinia dokdonensis]